MGKIHCAICKKKCKGDVLKLDQKFIHKECFNCYKCCTNLEKGGFFQRENRYYCTEDYQKLFGIKCGLCKKYADGEVVTILGGTFHIQCFKCNSCSHSFNCGDKATLWDGHYLCDCCASVKQEKENVSPPSFNHKSIIEADFIVPSSDKPTVAIPYTAIDSSDTEAPLHLHIENGYISTDSGVEKTKSEIGCLSPCFSTSSGDESWVKSSKPRKNKAHSYFQFGKCLNQSYLTIEERMSSRTPANARYRALINNVTPDPRNPHFHRPENFSYRSQPDINSKKVSPLTPNFANSRTMPPTHRVHMQLNDKNYPGSQCDVTLTEEVKRLAHFPDGREPDSSYNPPIDRYDFPAPPFSNMVLQDFKRERSSCQKRAVVSTGDIFSETQSGTDTAIYSTDYTESEDERVRKDKVERRLQALKSTGKYSGLSQSMLEEVEKRRNATEQITIDPVSSSRSPDASCEPSYKTRYERHTFTSPSRDSRYEGRATHQLQSKMQYTSTGGRTGTMSGYTSNVENDSVIRSQHSYRSCFPVPQPGYTAGYLSCGEGPITGRPTSSLSGRVLSLPRPLNTYTAQTSMLSPGYTMGSRMTPSMTASGYSVDATTHSIDESTLIGGSGILASHGPRDGYMSDMAPSSALYDSKRAKPEWYYESDNDAILHSNYPTVQSYLKPSSLLRSKEKIPAQVTY